MTTFRKQLQPSWSDVDVLNSRDRDDTGLKKIEKSPRGVTFALFNLMSYETFPILTVRKHL